MEKKWTCKDLHRSKIDVTLNTLLFICLVVSYLPQVNLILHRRNTSGIAQTYILSGYLFTATQFALLMVYSSWHYPVIPCLIDGNLEGLNAWGAVLGVVQDTVLWLGSATIVGLFILYPNESDARDSADHFSSTSTATDSAQSHRYPKTVLFLCIIHFLVWVLPLLIIAIPRPREPWLYEGGGFFIGMAFWLLAPLCMVMVIAQFPLQLKTILSSNHDIRESSLSLVTLAMQSIAFVLLGISWKIRFGWPGDPFNTEPPYRSPEDRYRFGGWVYVNNFIFGLGQGVLLLASLWARRVNLSKDLGVWDVNERTSLLGAD